MSVTRVEKDVAARTMTVTAHFDAAVEKVWQVWEDPRKLERWWGPPSHPATMVDHDLAPGGRVSYYMTGPDGAKYHGWWRVLSVEAPHRLGFEDGFADDTGAPSADLPVTQTDVTLSPDPAGGTTMVIVSTYPSPEAMEQVLAMGMEEGFTLALNQIDALLT